MERKVLTQPYKNNEAKKRRINGPWFTQPCKIWTQKRLFRSTRKQEVQRPTQVFLKFKQGMNVDAEFRCNKMLIRIVPVVWSRIILSKVLYRNNFCSGMYIFSKNLILHTTDSSKVSLGKRFCLGMCKSKSDELRDLNRTNANLWP